MRTLLDEKYAPITSVIGFINTSLTIAADALREWRDGLYGAEMRVLAPHEGFPQVLRRLEPLSSMSTRELLISTNSDWTAYLNCAWRGTDAWPATTYLAEKLAVRAVIATTVPHKRAGTANRRVGSVQFSLYGRRSDGLWGKSIRSVAAHFESRWEFHESGQVQPFEEVEAYGSRLIRDRFTSEMVERYCQALGIDVFNPGFYGPDAVFFERVRTEPPPGRSMSLADAQRELGITPGVEV